MPQLPDFALMILLAGWLLLWALREMGYFGIRRGMGPRLVHSQEIG